MPKQPKKIPYGEVERDLCNIARQRVADAINSVIQLADTKEQAFIITLHAMSQAVAMCAGTYSAAYVGCKEDPFDMAKVVLDIAKDAAATEGG